MYISLDILKKFVNLEDTNPKDIANNLTLHSFEIDDVINKADAFKNIIVGKISKIEKHPSADRLKVCSVVIAKHGGLFNKKEEIVQIVCGGTNIEEGMYVIVALPGSIVRWHGEGEPVEIKETELRGVSSYGMICASSEVGLSDIFPAKEETEIVDLESFKSQIPNDIKVGENIADLLGYNDVSFEVDSVAITHRPDLWGHYGVARELSAIYKKDLKPLELDELKNTSFTQLKVEVDSDLCRVYNAVKINNIKIEESPEWLKKALISAGHNPINNIVDLANYVMLEIAQPLHTYDSSKISNKIFVREGKTGEKIVTLDKKEVELDESMLIISDSIRPLGIAGVIGGLESAVSNNTTSIVLESANFDGTSIRKTMQKIGNRTDAGARYEKQLDIQFTDLGLRRFIFLLRQMNPKIIVENIQTYKKEEQVEKKISFDFDFIKTKIGCEIPKDVVFEILTSLGFKVDIIEERINVFVPFYRNRDINLKEDVIEEIARIYGYENISPIALNSSFSNKKNELRELERRVKEIMIDNNFSEVQNHSFISEKDQNEFGFNEKEIVKVINPLTIDQDRMNPILAINLLKNTKENLKNFDNVNIFEINRVFRNDKESEKYSGLPYQNYHLSACLTKKDIDVPFYELKNVLDKIFDLLKIKVDYVFKDQIIPSYCHPYRFAKIILNDFEIGFISEFNPKLVLEDKIKQRIAFFEIDFEKMFNLIEEKDIIYKSISKLQSSDFDISMVVNRDIVWKDIKEEIIGASSLVKDVKLFDIYHGDNLDNDKISLAFRIKILNEEKNMTSNEINEVYEKIISVLENRFKAEIRK